MLKSVQKLALALSICSAVAISPLAFSADEAMDEQAPAAAAPVAMSEGEAAPAELSAAAKAFQKLDTNKDGAIDKKEAKKNKKLARSFKKLAKAGKVNEEAFTKWFEKKSHKPKG